MQVVLGIFFGSHTIFSCFGRKKRRPREQPPLGILFGEDLEILQTHPVVRLTGGEEIHADLVDGARPEACLGQVDAHRVPLPIGLHLHRGGNAARGVLNAARIYAPRFIYLSIVSR